MTSPAPTTPRTQQEWEVFRFPVRPVSLGIDDIDSRVIDGSLTAPDDDVDDQDGEDGDGGREGGSDSLDLVPPLDTWVYEPVHNMLVNRKLHKKIALERLDNRDRIVRILAAIEAQDGWDVGGFWQAMEAASLTCFDMSLLDMLNLHSDGAAIVWRTAFRPRARESVGF